MPLSTINNSADATATVASLYQKLTPDIWRKENPFSAEFSRVQDALLATDSQDEQERLLSTWLQQHQPCLFGRIAAKWGLISYCFLNHDDLLLSDEAIRSKIADSRLKWSQNAYLGKKSAFVILGVSRSLTIAQPDLDLMRLSQRICQLYLLRDIEPDTIYTDNLILELPSARKVTWKWNVGVNFFSAAGDGRWWQDHRIPGGIGFSMNSVGHMVKSTIIAGKMNDLEVSLGLTPSDESTSRNKIASLPKALEMAMRTIHNASETKSGKATALMPLPTNLAALPVYPCPISLPASLADRNYCKYRGYYNTDETLPSSYFRPDADRPTSLSPETLDFTYLFYDDIDNPDFETTGAGQQIRTASDLQIDNKWLKSIGTEGVQKNRIIYNNI